MNCSSIDIISASGKTLFSLPLSLSESGILETKFSETHMLLSCFIYYISDVQDKILIQSWFWIKILKIIDVLFTELLPQDFVKALFE
jgi:hypothetical protein